MNVLSWLFLGSPPANLSNNISEKYQGNVNVMQPRTVCQKNTPLSRCANFCLKLGGEMGGAIQDLVNFRTYDIPAVHLGIT